ncbi:MAG: hypothetical protein ACI4VF_06345 [Lachnospirales bacterium]
MWILYVLSTIILWGITDIFYKKGANKDDKYMPFKFSVSIGLIFFIISICYIIIRDEPFSIWESTIRFWPMTIFGIIYAIINTFSFQGFMYNEASIVAPVENTANGSYVILLIIIYTILGRVNSIWDILTIYKLIGIVLIFSGLLSLGIVQNKEAKAKGIIKEKALKIGAGALIFPIVFSLMDGLETVITGLCLDKTFGFAMPEGDGIIIIGMEYTFFALCFWIYVSIKEKRVFNPIKKIKFIFNRWCIMRQYCSCSICLCYGY